MIGKKSHLQKFADQLQEWDAEIDVLKAQAAKAKTKRRKELYLQIEGLCVRNTTARNTLERLQIAGNGTRGSNESLPSQKAGGKRKHAFSQVSAGFK
jgi:hypothetical protein